MPPDQEAPPSPPDDATPRPGDAPPTSESMVCAVCARPLNWYRPADGSKPTWIHPFDAEIDDHLVVPVPRGEVETQGRCDFCHAPRPEYAIPVRSFLMDAPAEVPFDQNSGDDWAACTTCARLIDTGQWSAVTRRALDTFAQRHSPAETDEMRPHVARLYRQVRKNVTGMSKPLTP